MAAVQLDEGAAVPEGWKPIRCRVVCMQCSVSADCRLQVTALMQQHIFWNGYPHQNTKWTTREQLASWPEDYRPTIRDAEEEFLSLPEGNDPVFYCRLDCFF